MDLRQIELNGHKPGAFHRVGELRVGELIEEIYLKIALKKMNAKDKAKLEMTIQELVRTGATTGRYCLCQKRGLPAYIFENKKRIRGAGYEFIINCGKYIEC